MDRKVFALGPLYPKVLLNPESQSIVVQTLHKFNPIYSPNLNIRTSQLKHFPCLMIICMTHDKIVIILFWNSVNLSAVIIYMLPWSRIFPPHLLFRQELFRVKLLFLSPSDLQPTNLKSHSGSWSINSMSPPPAVQPLHNPAGFSCQFGVNVA